MIGLKSRIGTLLSTTIMLVAASTFAMADGWKKAKNNADDTIYEGRSATFYCGCSYISHEDRDGSGSIIEPQKCYTLQASYKIRACRVEWEHVVPVSLMPVSLMPVNKLACWVRPEAVEACNKKSGGNLESRPCCEKSDVQAQAMIFDLHNLVPSVGQINALRGNDRYDDLPNHAGQFGKCLVKDEAGRFEPPNCKKGDVARIWFYFRDKYNMKLEPSEEEMFTAWSNQDPVSPWESERERRIAEFSNTSNPYVSGITPTEKGACSWE